METTIREFADALQEKAHEHYIRQFGQENADNIHARSWKVNVRSGRKYTKVDLGDSGKFMVDNSTGYVYYIKGYGVVDIRKCFGKVQDILAAGFRFDGYSIVPLSLPAHMGARFGFAGRIA